MLAGSAEAMEARAYTGTVSTEACEKAGNTGHYFPEALSGSDGWLFARCSRLLRRAASADNDPLAQQWCDELRRRQYVLARQGKGIRFLHVCVPDKSTIMSEYVCSSSLEPAEQSELSALERLSKALEPDHDCLVNPVEYLRQKKTHYPLYWKTDTRWTPWSSYMTYQLLCSRLGVNCNDLLLGYAYDEAEQFMNLTENNAAVSPETVRQYRFHLRSIRRYANELTLRRDQLLAASDPLRSVNALGAGAHCVFENHHQDAVEQCIVVFGDENCSDSHDLLTGMLAETFSEVHFVWGESIDPDYVDVVKPDVVITQCAEHRLLQPPVSRFSMRDAANQSFDRLSKLLPIEREPTDANMTDGVKVLLGSERYALDPPTLVQKHGVCKSPETHMRSSEVTLLQVTNAEVFFSGPSWRVRDRHGKAWLDHEMPAEGWRFWRNSTKVLKGTTLMLATSAGAHCYYHWMLEILPKLGLLEREGRSIQSIDQVLVRQITSSWQLETLARFGIEGSRIVETVQRPYMRCENLLHVDLNCGINLKMHRFIPQWMKHLFTRADTSGRPRLKLYISRPQSVRRCISNEVELLPLLNDAGFTVTTLEGMSVADQAELLSRVDVLMSPHGGALTNMVFCRPGITVIELFSRHVFPYYYGLAANCGHHYHAILENPEEDYERLVNATVAQRYADTQNETADLPFAVSVDAVAQVLGNLQP